MLLAVGPQRARAIPNTCPTGGGDAGTVTIADPAPGATVSGQVTVRGRASVPGGVTRVELFAGDALKDFQVVDPAVPTVDYTLRFDAAGVASPRTTLAVVACGRAPAGGLARGSAAVDVQFDRGAASSAP